eukprot:TRINITY_DN36506_c0_g2_i1.p1 TRINITY_DN36506_c0_g2~~TRINITY_DN36506_c0_g2_i1.p1  ORF type:complete len:228 (-),score=40.22 TRINITY_DN36506_c0_g2_i1:143-826(-)
MGLARPFFTMQLLGLGFCAFVVLGVLAACWAFVLERLEDDLATVRLLLMLLFGSALCCEAALAATGVLDFWAYSLCLAAGLYSGLEGLIRFPASHGALSPFTLKSVVLAIVKAAAMFHSIIVSEQPVWRLVALLVLDVLLLPVAYIMAIPLDPALQVPADQGLNRDLLALGTQMLLQPGERSRYWALLRVWWHGRLLKASESSTVAAALLSLSPAYRCLLTKPSRSV